MDENNTIIQIIEMHNQILSMFATKRDLQVPRLDPVKFVHKANGIIKGYAVNTFHGMVKEYNEDRVSIIMNITKPNFKGKWPKCSYFGVFDGHGGDFCSNFLKDNMHRYITENQHFPTDPIEALKSGFRKAELEFLRFAQSQNPIERSGSCALVILIVDEMCYIANVGDSRAILSSQNGQKVFPLSNDHKPDCPSEKQRIQRAGGSIYQSIVKMRNGNTIPGPWRINPGKLSVSRTFGDIEGKLQKLGGNSKALIAKPEITYFEIKNDLHDFIVMGSDGIYDKLTNQAISSCFWEKLEGKKSTGLDFIGEASSQILTEAMKKMSMDNLTSLIIVFEDNGKFDLARKKTDRANSSRGMSENISSNINSHIENVEKPQIVSLVQQHDQKSERVISSKMLQKIDKMRRKNSANVIGQQNMEKQKKKPITSRNHHKKQNNSASFKMLNAKLQENNVKTNSITKLLKNTSQSSNFHSKQVEKIR